MRNLDLAQCFTGIFTLGIALAGCQSTVTTSPPGHSLSSDNLSHYELHRSQNKHSVTLQQLATEIGQSDVIFIGEYHTHSASHRLENQLLDLLLSGSGEYQLSLEQFTRDKQDVLNQYLAGEIGEQVLIKQGDAWGNYASDYRPLVELAIQHKVPVIAANTPINLIRCIGKQGPEVLQNLPENKKGWIAKDVTSSSDAYQAKFNQAMGHHGQPAKKGRPSNSFYAQLARDNTMAESIYRALQQAPNRKVIHINGAFHSDHYMGTVDALKRLMPKVKISVISPSYKGEALDWSQGDYLYTINPMPARYVNAENRNQAIRAMMTKKRKNTCEL